MGDTVDDRRVDHLSAPGQLGLAQGRKDARDEIQGTAAEIANDVERDLGRPSSLADRVEGSGDCDVTDVVTGRLRERPLLSPAGHPAVDQLGVAHPAIFWADAQPLRHARTVALDQDVYSLDHGQQRFDRLRLLQVEDYAALAAVEHVLPGLARKDAEATGAFNPDDLGTHVGEGHAGERPGSHAADLEDLDPRQRSRPD